MRNNLNMDMEWSKSNLFMTMGDTTISLGSDIPFIEEIELSSKESLSHYYNLKAMSSMNFTIDNINLESLYNSFNMPLSNGKFTIEYQMPIMIQARWHKNPRIRKKWLKRFGMKSDTIKVKADATTGEYHMDDGSFYVETDKREYILRPDQKRRGIKIEW